MFQPKNVKPVRVAVVESTIETVAPTELCETGVAVVVPPFALNVTVNVSVPHCKTTRPLPAAPELFIPPPRPMPATYCGLKAPPERA